MSIRYWLQQRFRQTEWFPLVNGVHRPGVDVLRTDGWPPNFWVLRFGDEIHIHGERVMPFIVEPYDVRSDGEGRAEFKVFPLVADDSMIMLPRLTRGAPSRTPNQRFTGASKVSQRRDDSVLILRTQDCPFPLRQKLNL
jgi:hypothetical protein